VRAGLTGVAAEYAISAIVAAEVRQGDKDLARIGDHAGLELTAQGLGAPEQLGKILVRAPHPFAGIFSSKRGHLTPFAEFTRIRPDQCVR